MDMETRYQSITNVSNDYFDRLIPTAIKYITAYRNVEMIGDSISPAFGKMTIIKPTQFQIKTAENLLEEYEASIKADMPIAIRIRQILDYTDKQFGGDDTMKKKIEMCCQLDKLFVLSETEKQQAVASNAASANDWMFNQYLPLILDDIIRDKGAQWFEESDFEAIEELVDAKWKAILQKRQEQSEPGENGTMSPPSSPPQSY